MKTSMKVSLDNLLMTAVVVTTGLMMAIGPVLTSPGTQAAMNSASRIVQSVSTPPAMEPIMYRDAAIIVSAPRLHQGA